jgi:glycosyltransferase involved in cell wall biosynthesis
MTKVTVVIPAFNSTATINSAIESVLRQQTLSGGPPAIIVVDDGSTDDLPATLEPYAGRITLIRHAANHGPAAARNSGIAAVESGYIAFLDADDEWLATKLLRQIELMQSNAWSACCTAYYLRHEDGSELVSPTYGTRELSLRDAVWGCFTGPGSTLVCERRVFDDVGLLDTRLGRLEDWDWQLRLLRRHQLGFVGEPLARVSKSRNREVDKVYAALDIIRSEHRRHLPADVQRDFDAAMDIERAAASYRAGKKLAAGVNLLKGVLRVPLRNTALSAVLHNRRRMRVAKSPV